MRLILCGVWGLLLAGFAPGSSLLAQSTVLYETGFERSEGYDPQFTLALQQGWVSEGSGGNGLIEDAFPGMGQQAYIGFHSPMNNDDLTSVWKPLTIEPLPAGQKILRFSVTIRIVESTGGGDDDFRWSIYNAAAKKLLSINFETDFRNITYTSEDGQFHSTGNTFDFEGLYDLTVWLNFERNLWTALLNDRVIVNSQTIAQSTADLTLGDIDAVWLIRNMTGIGNNHMIFDNYRITAEPVASVPGVLESVGVNEAGHYTFNVYAEKDANYSVDVTSDFREWFSLGTFPNPDGAFLFEDTTSKDEPMSFYRLRSVP